MEQESKTIQPTQEEIESAVKSAEKQMESFEESKKKIESEDKKMWRKLEEQMVSPEGMEDIKLSQNANKVPADLEELEKKQKFQQEYWKWERAFVVGATDFIGDLPSHIDEDVKFKNQNKFEIPIEFVDYLIDNALNGALEENVLNELKNMLGELNEIEFADILQSSSLMLLTLKSKYKKIALTFEVKYPFKFRAGKIFHENE